MPSVGGGHGLDGQGLPIRTEWQVVGVTHMRVFRGGSVDLPRSSTPAHLEIDWLDAFGLILY